MASENDEPGVGDITPAARAFIALLEGRPDEHKIAVLDSLRARFPDSRLSPAQEIHADALARCVHETGSGSKRSYEAWRESLADPAIVPTASRILRAFGGWTQARIAIGNEVQVDPTSARLRARPKYERQRVVHALEVWARSQTGLLRQQDFLDWCATEEAERQMGGPLPKTPTTANRLLGTWRKALVSLQIPQRMPPSAPAPDFCDVGAQNRKISRPSIDPSSLPKVGTTVRIEDQEIWAVWLRDLIGQEAFNVLRIEEYRLLREELQAEGARLGVVVALPSVGSVRRSGLGWRKFKSFAGYPLDEEATEAADGLHGRPLTSQQACVDALRRAAADLHHAMSRHSYDQWRRTCCPSAPVSSTIMRRLCKGKPSWLEARRAVLGEP